MWYLLGSVDGHAEAAVAPSARARSSAVSVCTLQDG